MNNENKYKEVIDLNRGRFILTLNDAEIEKTYIKGTDLDKTKKYVKAFMSSLRKYLNKAITYNNGVTTQKYEQKDGSGRVYVSKFGLQRCPSKLKAFLINGKYYDLDMKNAHFSILLNAVEEYNNSNIKYKLACKNLTKYVDKREEYLGKYKFKKEEAIMALYSDKIAVGKGAGYKTNNEFLIRLHKELTDIKRVLVPTNHETPASNTKNPYSSQLSKFIMDKENDILQKAISKMNEIDPIEFVIPMYDGFCVGWEFFGDRRTKEGMKELRKIAPKYIEWVAKEFDDGGHFSNNEIDERLNGSDLYDVVKPEYEIDRCYIKSTGAFQYAYLKEGVKVWIHYNESAMKLNSKQFQVLNEVTGKMEPIFERWISDKDKRQYECMDFIPFPPGTENQVDKGVFNTFSEFPWEFNKSESEDDVDLKEFLLNSIAGGEEETYKYLKMKLAHIIQFPNENPRVATILSGAQGVGKDTLIYLIKKLIGSQSVCATNNMEDIIPKKGSFNMQLKDKIVIEFNETQGRDGVEYIEQIKDFITRESNPIRELYLAPYNQKHIARLFILTNALNPIPMTDGQRRFVWQKIPSTRKGDTEYWNKFYKLMHDKVWIQKIGNQLLQVEGVREYFEAKVYPTTEVMKQYTKLNRNHAVDFLNYGILEGEHLTIHEYRSANMLYIQISQMYDKYKQYREVNHLSDMWVSTQFKKEILSKNGVTGPKLINLKRKDEGKQNQQRCFVIDLDKLKDELQDLYAEPEDTQEDVETVVCDDDLFIKDELD